MLIRYLCTYRTYPIEKYTEITETINFKHFNQTKFMIKGFFFFFFFWIIGPNNIAVHKGESRKKILPTPQRKSQTDKHLLFSTWFSPVKTCTFPFPPLHRIHVGLLVPTDPPVTVTLSLSLANPNTSK